MYLRAIVMRVPLKVICKDFNHKSDTHVLCLVPTDAIVCDHYIMVSNDLYTFVVNILEENL